MFQQIVGATGDRQLVYLGEAKQRPAGARLPYEYSHRIFEQAGLFCG
jgi:hypothetical protein